MVTKIIDFAQWYSGMERSKVEGAYQRYLKEQEDATAQVDAAPPEKHEKIKEVVLAEYKNGNIVVSTFEGLKVAPLKEIIKQPVDGLLYDLNRNEAVILTFINDPKWINDYAMAQVLRELKEQIDAKN